MVAFWTLLRMFVETVRESQRLQREASQKYPFLIE